MVITISVTIVYYGVYCKYYFHRGHLGKQWLFTTDIHSLVLEMLQCLPDVAITLRLALTRSDKMLPLGKSLLSRRPYLHQAKPGVGTAAHQVGHRSECEGCVRWSTACVCNNVVLGLPS